MTPVTQHSLGHLEVFEMHAPLSNHDNYSLAPLSDIDLSLVWALPLKVVMLSKKHNAPRVTDYAVKDIDGEARQLSDGETRHSSLVVCPVPESEGLQ